ncbi:hypothetical protein PV08_08432 [Exophiala spinifera]|uniref:MARVEL domain-containing protein n=1 Tax=Exophiala spinifera TaxID=91928 RepID=A0A0D2B3K3_9EURO|nr:uncharacterized protein PV08_08432 [Exophiala spinifera]KIW13245.1 hypothetical protein PV08_08432 [Exophiala spinifera]
MKFTTRRVSTGTGFAISRPQLQTTFPPPPVPAPSRTSRRPQDRALHQLHEFRTIGLPMLLVLVFTTLILNAIYAYCVAKPHTDIAERLSKDATAEANGSIFRRSGSLRVFSDAHLLATRDNAAASTGTSSTSEVALLFYTLFTPCMSLVHLCFELTAHHATPRHLRSKAAFLVLTPSAALFVAGWVTTLSFWMHCELPSLNSNPAGQAVCPAQVRGHFMYGIHEVSIAKIAVGWVVSLAYALHVLVLARAWRIGGSGSGSGSGNEALEHGETATHATEIAVGLDMKPRAQYQI